MSELKKLNSVYKGEYIKKILDQDAYIAEYVKNTQDNIDEGIHTAAELQY